MRLSRRFAILPAVLVGFTACGEDTTSTTCTEDFDCPVGQVCGGTTDEMACEDAAPGTEKTFGRVTADFTNGDEVYLLGVHTLPVGEASADSFAAYSITGSDGSGSPLRLWQPARSVDPDPLLNAKIAFETRQRTRLNRLIDDLHAGIRTLRPATGRQAAACPTNCGTDACDPVTRMCASSFDLTFHDASTTLTVNVVDVIDVPGGSGLQINVLLDAANDDGPTRTAVTNAVTQFAGTLSAQLGILGTSGHSADLDRDGDGRLSVVFTNETGSGADSISTDVVGFFDFLDFLPTAGTGNETDILWSRVIGTSNIGGVITEELAVGTLTHEYVHLYSYGDRVHARDNDALREVVWLDEGLAHLFEDLAGWGGSNVGVVEQALDNWTDAGFATSVDTVPQRGRAYLLLRHMIDQRAKSTGASMATDIAVRQAANGLITQLISENALGWEHSAFQELGGEGVWEYIVATYATNNPDVTNASANAFDYLTPNMDSGTGNLVGFDPFGDFTTARGVDTTFFGVVPEDITDVLDFTDGDVLLTGNQLFLMNGLTGNVTIEATGDADVDFQLNIQRVQ